MKLLLIFLGTILGIFIFLAIIAFIVYVRIKKFAKGIGYSNLSEIKSMIKDGEDHYKYDHKMVSGMTNLLIPRIVADFPNFSETELFNKVETSLLSIFSSFEDLKVSNLKELSLIKDNINEQIKDMKDNKVRLTYDDVKFHKHAIKDYRKEEGAISVTISTALEYYYKKDKNSKSIVNQTSYKRQTSYTTTFIYIYDSTKYNKAQTLIGIHCPNCGAPLKNLEDRICHYCNSGLDDINLKSWYLSSYKEDY